MYAIQSTRSVLLVQITTEILCGVEYSGAYYRNAVYQSKSPMPFTQFEKLTAVHGVISVGMNFLASVIVEIAATRTLNDNPETL